MREIDDIHVPFKAWLDERRVPYVYHRPDRKSGISEGHPDFTILWQRRQIGIECKTTSGKLSLKQLARIDYLRRSGNVVEIARNLSECIDAVYKVLCDGKPSTEADSGCNYPLEPCFRELKRAVAAVPGNGTKDLSGGNADNGGIPRRGHSTPSAAVDAEREPAACKHSGQSDQESSSPAQNFFIIQWQGNPYVVARNLDGKYDSIRPASPLDVINLPPLPKNLP